MSIKVTGGVKVPQGKFKVYVAPPPPLGYALWAWGRSNTGQLGDGTIVNKSSPVQIGALTDWSTVSGGTAHSLAVKTDGTLWAWGDNSPNGQLGDGTIVDKSSPVQIGALTDWSSVNSKQYHAHAIKTNGTLWAWGLNGANGLLGLGDSANRSSPVQVGALTNWSNVDTGQYHSLAIKTDGTLWAWGNGANGELGQGDTLDKNSPVQVGALTTWACVAAGSRHSLAIKTDGTLWAWGDAANGRLGDGTIVDKSSPIQVGVLTNWAQCSVSAADGHSHVIKTDDTLWAWGRNASGRLGDGTTIDKSSPVQIGSLTDWSSVDTTGFHTLSIKTDGSLWAWGRSSFGRLGDGTTIDKSSPVQIGALTTWSKIGAGYGHSLALKTS